MSYTSRKMSPTRKKIDQLLEKQRVANVELVEAITPSEHDKDELQKAINKAKADKSTISQEDARTLNSMMDAIVQGDLYYAWSLIANADTALREQIPADLYYKLYIRNTPHRV